MDGIGLDVGGWCSSTGAR